MPSTFVRIGRYVLDVSLSESHTFEADVTDFPVESGGSISDHIRPKPIKISIEGIVSDTPLDSNAANKPVILGDPYTPGVDAFTTQVTSLLDSVKFLRSEEAFGYLKWIWENGETVTIRTSLGTFDNMAMESFTIPRDKDTGGGLKFSASFKQIQKVTNARLVRQAVRNGGKKKNKGTQSGDDYFIGDVLWSKGIPPGGNVIYEIEWIRWYWKPALAGGGSAVKTTKKTATVNQPVAAANVRENHKWYHWSHPTKGVPNPQPLTDSEVQAFYADRKRDVNAKTDAAAKRAGQQAQEAVSGYMAKTPQGQMSQINKDRWAKMYGEEANTSGDPKFNNNANYIDKEQKPSLPKSKKIIGTPKIGE